MADRSTARTKPARQTRSSAARSAAARAEAERYTSALLAPAASARSARREQLLDVLLHATVPERFRVRFERPLEPAEQAQLSEAQAEVIVEVIESTLRGLGLGPEQLERGRELAAAGLRGASEAESGATRHDRPMVTMALSPTSRRLPSRGTRW